MKGLIAGTGFSPRQDAAAPVQGAVPRSSLPAWMFSGGVIKPPFTWFPIGTRGDPLSDTSLHDAYLRNPSAQWDLQDMDIGDCHRIGGYPPGVGSGQTRVGNWLGMSRAFSGAAVRNATSHYICQGAGHVYGFGNRALYIDLRQDKPLWALMSRGTPPTLIQGTPPGDPGAPNPGLCNGPGGVSPIPRLTQQFLDGRNIGGQTGYNLQYFQNLDKYVTGITLGPAVPGGFMGAGNIRTFDWSAAGVAGGGAADSATGWNPTPTQFPSTAGEGQYGLTCCYASRGGVDFYYIFTQGKFMFWNYPNATMSNFGSRGTLFEPWYKGMAYDSKRDQLVVLDHTKWRLYIWNCATGGAPIEKNLITNIPVSLDSTPNSCLEYDDVNDVLLFNDGRQFGNWWTLDPKVLDANGGYTLTPISVFNAPVTDATVLTFNRARLVPNLGVIVCTNNSDLPPDFPLDSQLYAMRIR